MAIRIGISGWRYAPWRGVFYPENLQQRRELEYASGVFPTIEINGSFYSLQSPKSWQAWHDQTPPGFVFAVKGPRYITHLLRLREFERALANFLASGVLRLGPKLGPVLWQFPPNFRFDESRFDRFFAQLPKDTDTALELARRRERSRMRGRTALPKQPNRRLRHAVEIRHDSFRDEAFIRLLRRHNIALVVADTAGRWPLVEDVTADFLYLRLHGDEELYVSGYTDEALETWAQRIDAWARGREPGDARRIAQLKPLGRKSRDVYCYFDNDAKVHAPFDAQNLALKLGLVQEVTARGKPAKLRKEPPPIDADVRAARVKKAGHAGLLRCDVRRGAEITALPRPRRRPAPATAFSRPRPGPA